MLHEGFRLFENYFQSPSIRALPVALSPVWVVPVLVIEFIRVNASFATYSPSGVPGSLLGWYLRSYILP